MCLDDCCGLEEAVEEASIWPARGISSGKVSLATKPWDGVLVRGQTVKFVLAADACPDEAVAVVSCKPKSLDTSSALIWGSKVLGSCQMPVLQGQDLQLGEAMQLASSLCPMHCKMCQLHGEPVYAAHCQ